jgi:cytochrome c-type biogenesis protein CcmH/NrfF
MSWALWLLAPVAVTVLAAVASWVRSRPARPPNTEQAMRAHDEFLAALGRSTRPQDRPARSR